MNICRNNHIEKAHCYLVSAFLLLTVLACLYMYLLSATVVHVVMQKEGKKEINELHSEISQLEAEYISRQHAVSSEIASMQGFIATNEKIFIDKGDDSLVLLTNDR